MFSYTWFNKFQYSVSLVLYTYIPGTVRRPLVLKVTPSKQGLNSNQNKCHLSSRYICIYIYICEVLQNLHSKVAWIDGMTWWPTTQRNVRLGWQQPKMSILIGKMLAAPGTLFNPSCWSPLKGDIPNKYPRDIRCIWGWLSETTLNTLNTIG